MYPLLINVYMSTCLGFISICLVFISSHILSSVCIYRYAPMTKCQGAYSVTLVRMASAASPSASPSHNLKAFSQAHIFNTIGVTATKLAHIHRLAVCINNHYHICDPHVTDRPQFIVLCQYLPIYDQWLPWCGPCMSVYGPYRPVYDPFLPVYGPCLHVYGPYRHMSRVHIFIYSIHIYHMGLHVSLPIPLYGLGKCVQWLITGNDWYLTRI